MSKELRNNIMRGIACGCIVFVVLGIRHELMCSEEVCSFFGDFTSRAVGIILVSTVIMASSTFIKRFGILLTFSLHAGVGIATYLVVALVMGWVSFDTPTAALIWLGIRILRLGAVLLVLWFIDYRHSKREARRINEKLKGLS